MVNPAGRVGEGCCVSVWDPMIKADADRASEIRVPATVIGASPGTKVWLPMMNPPAFSFSKA